MAATDVARQKKPHPPPINTDAAANVGTLVNTTPIINKAIEIINKTFVLLISCSPFYW